jgi:hypothetical protein
MGWLLTKIVKEKIMTSSDEVVLDDVRKYFHLEEFDFEKNETCLKDGTAVLVKGNKITIHMDIKNRKVRYWLN